MNTLHKTIVLTATGVATFLILGLATPETTPDTAPAPASQAVRKALEITPENTPQEDDPTWNCFTQGNKDCGTLPQVTQELGDALAEGEDATGTATTRDWELCVYAEGDTTYIYCPDGYTQSS